jgi:hypothetical protein
MLTAMSAVQRSLADAIREAAHDIIERLLLTAVHIVEDGTSRHFVTVQQLG